MKEVKSNGTAKYCKDKRQQWSGKCFMRLIHGKAVMKMGRGLYRGLNRSDGEYYIRVNTVQES